MQVLFRLAIFIAAFTLPGAGRIEGCGSDSISNLDSAITKMYVITGSDWCPNCKRFEEKVLQDTLFQAHLKKASICVEIIDFPQKMRQTKQTVKYNDSMAGILNFNGNFPGIILANAQNKRLNIAYKNETASEFILLLKSKLNQAP